jgi:hypothetical protein
LDFEPGQSPARQYQAVISVVAGMPTTGAMGRRGSSRKVAVWTQQGAKLVGTGAVGAAYQGKSVSLSAGGNIAIVGGWADNSSTRSAVPLNIYVKLI